ncbi:MAG TPA: DNA gyrase modulator [Egibacteraceae bacterium]|nr:DNA gyrase modulator [Egibacteraceae bacterium]
MTQLTLEDGDVRAVLRAALSTGGEFAEIYAEDRRARNLRLDDGRVEDVVSGVDRGAGVRVVAGRRTAYAYTNVLTRDALVEAAKAASTRASRVSTLV